MARTGPQPKVDGTSLPHIDYTEPLRKVLAMNAQDESRAELEGWNSVISYQHHKNPGKELAFREIRDYKRSLDYIQLQNNQYVMKPGYEPNSDLTLSASPANEQAMQSNYYDAAKKLGITGQSDYPNYYATSHISYIAQAHTLYAPAGSELMVNMRELKLSEAMIEREGLFIDFEKNGQRVHQVPYTDPATPHVQRQFDHTTDKVYNPATHQTEPNPNVHQSLHNQNPDVYTLPHLNSATMMPPPPSQGGASHAGAPAHPLTESAELPALTRDTLPPAAQTLLAHSEDKVRELFTREKLDHDKQHGDLFTLATAKLAAERGLENFQFIGVDREKSEPTLMLGDRVGLILKTAGVPTVEVGQVKEQQVFQSLVTFAQEKENPSLAQQPLQQEQPQHKGPSIGR